MSQPPEKALSVIIPARNEEALIGRVIEAVLAAAGAPTGGALPHLDTTGTELIVVDNLSTDRTAEIAGRYAERHGIRLISCDRLKSPCARNVGAGLASGRIFVFVDADTIIPPHALRRIQQLCDDQGYGAGITWLASLEGGRRAWCWWTFWCHVRRLPLARAKAMPALMFCARDIFQRFGPFDERVVIGEEWPILAGLYRAEAARFVYDRTLTALTSSRRMELQPLGYTRTLLKYIWAVLHQSGRRHYGDHWRYSR